MKGLRLIFDSLLLRVMTLVSAALALVVCAMTAVQAQGLKGEIFPPASGKGAIVIVVSGASGTPLFRDFSSKLAGLGYYTVLINGRGVIIDPPGAGNLRAAIAESQSAAQAIPGKVALVGLSLGGGGCAASWRPVEGSGVGRRGLLSCHYRVCPRRYGSRGKAADTRPTVRGRAGPVQRLLHD
jgi:hypothetical protein